MRLDTLSITANIRLWNIGSVKVVRAQIGSWNKMIKLFNRYFSITIDWSLKPKGGDNHG